jgi:hypothetical protein
VKGESRGKVKGGERRTAKRKGRKAEGRGRDALFPLSPLVRGEGDRRLRAALAFPVQVPLRNVRRPGAERGEGLCDGLLFLADPSPRRSPGLLSFVDAICKFIDPATRRRPSPSPLKGAPEGERGNKTAPRAHQSHFFISPVTPFTSRPLTFHLSRRRPFAFRPLALELCALGFGL